MFVRVAVWSIAVFVAVLPTRSSVETDTLAPFPDPAVVVALQNVALQSLGPAVEPRSIAVESDAASIEAQPSLQNRAAIGAPSMQLAALDPAEPAIAASPIAAPFGRATVRISSGDVLTKWNTVQAQISAEGEILARCRDGGEPCPAAAQSFLAVIEQGRALTGRARIGVINRAINLAIAPMSDLAQWGVPDRWSPPLETFTTGRGDCEDYAIAKYVALTAAGVAAADVKLVIVRNTAVNEDHAVVTVRLDGDWVVLDNRRLTLVADYDMREAVPLFALDGDGVRKFAAPMLTGVRQPAAPAAL